MLYYDDDKYTTCLESILVKLNNEIISIYNGIFEIKHIKQFLVLNLNKVLDCQIYYFKNLKKLNKKIILPDMSLQKTLIANNHKALYHSFKSFILSEIAPYANKAIRSRILHFCKKNLYHTIVAFI